MWIDHVSGCASALLEARWLLRVTASRPEVIDRHAPTRIAPYNSWYTNID